MWEGRRVLGKLRRQVRQQVTEGTASESTAGGADARDACRVILALSLAIFVSLIHKWERERESARASDREGARAIER